MPTFKAEIGHMFPPHNDTVTVLESIEAPATDAALQTVQPHVAETNKQAWPDRRVGEGEHYSGTVTVIPVAA